MTLRPVAIAALCMAISIFLAELAWTQSDVFEGDVLLQERTYYLDECTRERKSLVVPQDVHDARAPAEPIGHVFAMECFSGWSASAVSDARSLVVFHLLDAAGQVVGLTVDVYDPNMAWSNTAYATFLQRISYNIDECGLFGDVHECPGGTQARDNQRPQLRWYLQPGGFIEVLSE